MNDHPTILVVDDTTESLALMERILISAGYRARLADSGELALTAIASLPPDLVLLDVRMPGWDGLEVCRRLKANEETRAIPVILVSALAEARDWAEGLRMGAVDFVTKPVNPDELLTRVATHLAVARSKKLVVEATTLRVANEQLQAEINRRQQAEADLRNSLATAERAERALRVAHERLELAQRAAGSGTWDWDIVTGRIEWSREMFILFGLDPAADQAGFDTWRRAVHPEDRQVAEGRIAAAVRDHTVLDSEYRFVSRDGSVRWMQALGHTTYDASGTALRMTGLCFDITSRKQMEAALLESDANLQALFNATTQTILLLDLQGTVMAVNEVAARRLGRSPAEMLGTCIYGYLPPENVAARRARLAEVVATGRAVRFEDLRAGRHIDQTLVPVHDPTGAVTRVAVFAEDITERKQRDDTLRALLREKEALLKEVHHRVKNNLQVITSLLRLEAGQCAESGTKAVLKEMQGRIHSMALLHETLYRSGNFDRVDLATYLKQLATQLFRAHAVEPGVVRLQLDLLPAQVELDRAIPCGLLVNELVTNCLKHAFPDRRAGVVRIGLHPVADGLLRIQVSDTGRGLPADFDLSRSTTLGLQLVSDLTRQLQGSLEISPPGPGASFGLTLAAGTPLPSHPQAAGADQPA